MSLGEKPMQSAEALRRPPAHLLCTAAAAPDS